MLSPSLPLSQGKGKGKTKGKGPAHDTPVSTEQEETQSLPSFHKLKSLDVFAGCGGK